MKKSIRVLVGPICSGKTTWCDGMIKIAEGRDIPTAYIKISSIVKRLSSAESRSELQNTANLEKQISEELISEIGNTLQTADMIFIDGIRQLDILLKVMTHFTAERQISVEATWLEVDRDERRRRFYKRKQPRDLDMGFDEADSRDRDLGLDKIEHFLKLTNIHS